MEGIPIKKNNSKENSTFHSRTYNYSHADFNSLCGHLRDASYEDISELGASAGGTDFVSWSKLELMYISLIINQFKPHVALSFSAA